MSALEVPSALEVHKTHSRKDLVSKSTISCELCPNQTGSVRDIRKHLRTKHQKESFFKCMDRRCDFVCSIKSSCFIMHAIRHQGEYFKGRSTKLQEHKLFKLVIINPKKKENMYNNTCDLESEIENCKKKHEIKRRSTGENKFLRKFLKITDIVCTDVNVAKELYEGAFSDWKVLDTKYPRKEKSSSFI